MNPFMRPANQSEGEIFDAALACSNPTERTVYLDKACAGQPELRQRVEALLAAHDQATGFLENPNARTNPNPTVRLELPGDERIGDVIGHYKIREKIGEGGCGVVYVADQEKPVRRRVALKVVKLGMDTKQVVARFEAERQALALMDHPNIAKVLDAGSTSTGRPFFVMELVRGIKITEYCDQNNLSTEDRLKLFMLVCQAVQHAHQKGIIHRDIKPSNVLVTLHDGVPVPKVIDFGIAKATSDQRLTDKTIYTAFEQFLGTPAYMSPEQAEMSGLDIDTRSDIYSLGVLLYELLTGKTPFDPKTLMQAGIDQMRRIIREQEPQRPSTRLSTLTQADLTTLAKQRHAEAPKLIHLISGDLDWIVMKCLEKDRTRRYETANGLAVEINRHLSNEPVTARPPSVTYRLQKLVTRYKLAAAFLLAFTVCLVAGISASTLFALRAQRAEREQSRLRQEAEASEVKSKTEANRAEAASFEARGTLSAWNFSQASRLIQEGNATDALPYLSSSLTANPSNTAAMMRLFDLLTYRSWMLPTLTKHFDSRINSVQFAGDGESFLTASEDGTVQLWQSRDGLPIRSPLKHDGPVQSADFLSEGKQILTFAGVELRLWTTATGQLAIPALKHPSMVKECQFSPDARSILSVTESNTVHFWDAGTGLELGRPLRVEESIESVSFTKDDENQIIVIYSDYSAQKWDLRTGEPVTESCAYLDYESFSFSPDEDRVVTIDEDGNICVWDVETGEIVNDSIEDNSDDPVTYVEFSEDGERIVGMTDSEAVRIWDAITGELLPDENDDASTAGEFYDDSENRIIVFLDDETIEVWTPYDSEQVFTPGFGPKQVPQIGRRVSSKAGKTEQIKLNTKAEIATESFDGKRMITVQSDQTLQVWETQTHPPIDVCLERYDERAVASPTPTNVVTGLGVTIRGNTVAVTGKVQGKQFSITLNHDEEVRLVLPTHGGKQLLTLSVSGWLNVWEIPEGVPATMPILGSQSDTYADARFSPSEKQILALDSSGKVRMWDEQSGQMVRDDWLPMGAQEAWTLFAVYFVSDGKSILAHSTNGSAYIADVAPITHNHPTWLPELVEAISGQSLNKNGILQPTKVDRIGFVKQLREKLRNEPEDDWVVWGRWLLADPIERTLRPFSKVKIRDFFDEQIRRQTDVSLNNAERLAQSDSSMLSRVATARAELNWKQALSAAGQGDSESQVRVAQMYFKGEGVAKNTSEALKWFRKAVESENVEFLNSSARLLALSSDPSVRASSFAVPFAEKAVTLSSRKEACYLDTLALALGEAGRFQEAAATQREAIALLKTDEEKIDYNSRLKLYESGKPYHEDGN